MVIHRDVQGELPNDMTNLLDFEGTEARLRRDEGIPKVATPTVTDPSKRRSERRELARRRLADRRLV
ncbi:MAG: hypothetical protein AAFZ07_19470 [Actinomycetota bacterium]